ncbi:hypothetical protein L1F30_01650 [Simiduia sp. 21SJ11W-1]|uniref:hypothetical protein n=1 Tax=Simiduia sp. 21SJ11W-1 TaxID=2909669 RepID=UPI00209DA152|nr:hypothetical protein [Simiduia sp. 21SJ11W-1]UTA48258.1 hypothetical protein L1F30_01650 [Simiduia sp. 21SJ11W-1]
MFEELLNNIEWLFSGLGVVIGIAALNFIRKLKFSAPAKFLTHISEYLVSLFRSSEDIAKNVDLDLRPRNTPFELWLHELPRIQAWLKVINLNPFSLSIKNISLEFGYGGLTAKSKTDFHDLKVEKYSVHDGILAEGDLTGEQADYIAKYQDNPQCRITIRATLKSPSKEISYENSWLEGVPVRLVNDQQRKARLLVEKIGENA